MDRFTDIYLNIYAYLETERDREAQSQKYGKRGRKEKKETGSK